MSSRKPVIHGRDHLLGGADPIPITPGSEAALGVVSYVGGGSPLTLAAKGSPGAQNIIGWNFSFETTDPSVFATVAGGSPGPANNTSGDNGLLIMKPGIVWAFARATWDAGTYQQVTFINIVAFGEENLSETRFSTMEALTDNKFGSASIQIEAFSTLGLYVPETGPGPAGNGVGLLNLNVENWDAGSTHTVSEAMMACYFWPIAEPLETIW